MAVKYKNGIETSTLKVTGGSPAASKVLTSDASGNATWQTPASGGGGGTVPYTTTIGDGSTLVYTVTHNLGTRDLFIDVRETNSPYERIVVNIATPTINTVTLDFTGSTAPASGEYTVIISKAEGGSASATKTFWVTHSWAIAGEIKVASGQIDIIPRMFVSKTTDQLLSLAKLRCYIEAGTSVTFKLQCNGTDITGFTGIVATPAGTAVVVDPTNFTLADGDMIQPIVTAVSGTPTNFTIGITLEHTI